MPEISNIPQEPVLGGVAGALRAIRDLAQKLGKPGLGAANPLWQAVEALVGKKPEMAEDASYGFPPTKGTGFALTPKEEYSPEFGSLVPQGGPLHSLAMKGLAAKLGGLGLAGTLRAGGRPDLMYSHGGEPEDLLRHGELRPETYATSLAIEGGSQLRNPFDHGLSLIPREGMGDPRYMQSTLRNRDFYVARANEWPGSQRTGGPSVQAVNRMLDRFTRNPRPFSEGRGVETSWKPWVQDAHHLLVHKSPHFRSFAEYEASPKGAGLLVPGSKGDTLSHASSVAVSDAYEAWREVRGIPSTSDWVKELTKAAKEGDTTAKLILEASQKAPTNYAELKLHGPLPLTGDYWAGAIIKDPSSRLNDSLAQALEARGIRVAGREVLPEENFRLAQSLQSAAGPFKLRNFKDSPWQGRPSPTATGGLPAVFGELEGVTKELEKQAIAAETKQKAWHSSAEEKTAPDSGLSALMKDYQQGFIPLPEMYAKLFEAQYNNKLGLGDELSKEALNTKYALEDIIPGLKGQSWDTLSAAYQKEGLWGVVELISEKPPGNPQAPAAPFPAPKNTSEAYAMGLLTPEEALAKVSDKLWAGNTLPTEEGTLFWQLAELPQWQPLFAAELKNAWDAGGQKGIVDLLQSKQKALAASAVTGSAK